jgi:phosphatidylglycerophosphatase A
MKPDRHFFLSHPAHFIAFGGGAGLAARAPGTWGTLVALPIFFLAGTVLPWAGMLLLCALLFALGVWASERAGRALGVADHGGIVIDEIVAFMLVLLITPLTWLWVLYAFVLFRLFDIFKPWPISVADRHIKGGIGVMLDDLLAAGYAVICIIATRALIQA